MRSVTVQSGYPVWAATRPYSPTSSTITTNRRWEICFDPRPASIQTVIFPYTMHFNKLQMRGGTSTEADATSLTDSSRREPKSFFNGWVIKIIHGTGKFSYATVTGYESGVFTVTDWLDEDGGAGGTDAVSGDRYIVQPAANVHPAGFRFDNVVEAACKARAQMETDDAGTNWIEEYRKVALPEAHVLDSRSAPRRLGPLMNGPRECRRREFDDVTTDNDE